MGRVGGNGGAQVLPALYRDEHLIAIDRPAALPVRSPYAEEGAGVLEILEASGLGPVFEGARFGRGCSGVVLLGRSREAAVALKNAAGSLSLTFLALARGKPREVSSKGGARVEVVRRQGKGALLRCAITGGGVKEARAALHALGVSVDEGPLGLRLMAIEGPHPITGEPLEIRCEGDGGASAALAGELDVEALVGAALRARASCALDLETDAWRLLGGAGDGLAGVTAARFGPAILLHTREGEFEGDREAVASIGRALLDGTGAEGVFWRQVSRQGGAGEVDEVPLVGAPCAEAVVIRERGLKYLIRPHHGLSPGLFLDQRHNRVRVRQFAEGARVLNTFAHTCGFSVAAAAGGAAEVVSVDALRPYLSWGRENLALNGLPEDNHVFIASDVMDYLGRSARQGRLFDLVVLDPPTFGRDKKTGRTFVFERDLKKLLEATAAVTSPGGRWLLSTNHRGTRAKQLREAVADALGPRSFEVELEPRLPPDFAGDPDFAQTLWVRLG